MHSMPLTGLCVLVLYIYVSALRCQGSQALDLCTFPAGWVHDHILSGFKVHGKGV